jgi:hypothetical protein
VALGLKRGLIYSSVNRRIYRTPGPPPPPTDALTDEYSNFILFLLLPVLAASPDGEPPKHAQYT